MTSGELPSSRTQGFVGFPSEVNHTRRPAKAIYLSMLWSFIQGCINVNFFFSFKNIGCHVGRSLIILREAKRQVLVNVLF